VPISGNNPIPFEELLAVFMFLAAGIYLFTVWVRASPAKPDPWEGVPSEVPAGDATAEESLVCLHCLTPHSPDAYFCPHCNAAVGQYNNWMPYLTAFSEGQVWRAGVLPGTRRSRIVLIGFVLLSLPLLATAATAWLAPAYWILVWRNFNRSSPPAPTQRPPDVEALKSEA
jgi:hypothetical protein